VTESGTSWSERGPQGGARSETRVDDGLAVLEQIERELVEVDAALVRLDDGTYGTCRVCSATIDDATLADRPTTDVCPAHETPPSP
jgi:RNA polymerase-binding transcription factor DksA